MMSRVTLAILCASGLSFAGSAAHAQSLPEAAAAAKITNEWPLSTNVPPEAASDVPATMTSAAVRNDPDRQEALASLRAVPDFLGGGAVTSEFKTYYLAAKGKIDALPEIPENAPLRDVIRIYADAASLYVAGQLGQLSAAEALSFREKYSSDSTTPFARVFQLVPRDGFGPTIGTKYDTARGTIGANAGAQLLLVLAAKKLQAIQ
jgi:hypothetical protein